MDFVGLHSFSVLAGGAVCGAWIIGEFLARRSTWIQGAPRKPASTMDRGTYPVIALGIAASMSFTLIVFLYGIGGYLPVWTTVVGLGVAAVGLGIRAWALRTLGRFFTMPITIAVDHRLIQNGPYRWLRHPAYTGGFLTAIGVPLTLGSWVGAVGTVVFCIGVYAHRIQIEEGVLRARFGKEYLEYSARTSRLLPGVY
jgi:protein-S-isoprenylcysteine O-methyltransferase Ste14